MRKVIELIQLKNAYCLRRKQGVKKMTFIKDLLSAVKDGLLNGIKDGIKEGGKEGVKEGVKDGVKALIVLPKKLLG